MRGKCYSKIKNFHMAIKDFRQVVQMEPDNEDDRLNLIQVLGDDDQYDEAIEGNFELLYDNIPTLILAMLSTQTILKKISVPLH